MTTTVETDEFRRLVDDLSTLAIRDLNALLREIDGLPPERARDLLLDAFPEIVTPYAETASQAGAVWYEDVRRNAIGGRLYAEAAPTASAEQLTRSARWAAGSLFEQTGASLLSLISGAAQRAVADGARGSVMGNIARDPVKVRYARTPKTGCCAFCAMLASRGAVYLTEASASKVSGRGVEISASDQARIDAGYTRRANNQFLAGGVKARGSQAVGSEGFHDHCRCVPTPVFSGESVPYDLDHYKRLYAEAAKPFTPEEWAALTQEQQDHVTSLDGTQSVLWAMRQQGLK